MANEIHAGGESASTVKVHPALATVDVPAQTVRQLDQAMSNADASGRARARTARKVRQAVRELLQKAVGEHTARMQLTGTHHRLAERAEAS